MQALKSVSIKSWTAILGSLNQRKVTEFKIPSLSKPRRFPAGDTGLRVDDHGGPAALSRAQLTDHGLWYLLVQNFKEPLSQACVCFLSGHGHFDSVLHGQWISSWQSWEISETTTDIAEASLTHAAVQSLSSVWLCNPTNCSPPGSSCLWDSPDKNTGVGCHFLLQWIFPTQGLNPRLLRLQADSLTQTQIQALSSATPEGDSEPGLPSWLLHSALGLHLIPCLSFPVCTMGTMAAPDSGTPCLAHLGGSSNTCYFYQANIHPGPETLPEEVEVRAPHESECKVMPLWQLQTWPPLFEGQDFKHLCLFRTETPWSREFTWLAELGANIPYPSLFLLGTFFFPLIVPFWDIDMAANPGTKQGMETVWGNNPGGGACWVSGGRGRGVMWGLCKTFPAGERVSGDRLLKQWHLLPTSLSHHQRNDILRKIKH